LIKARRKELGFSQQDLARMIGVPAANLSELEHSPSRWRSRLIPALAVALDVSQLELVLAARVINDLPPFPSSAATNGHVDPLYTSMEINGSREESPQRLRQLSRELTLDETEFLVAVAETFRVRRSGSKSQRDLRILTSIGASIPEPIEGEA
jgi:DNA-binding XRE family transcriptional regulator